MLKRNSVDVHSNTLLPLALLQICACQKREPAGRILGDFGNLLNGFAKSPRLIVLNIE